MKPDIATLSDAELQKKIQQLDRAILHLRKRRDLLLQMLMQRATPEAEKNTTVVV